jgi:hypothetical protein
MMERIDREFVMEMVQTWNSGYLYGEDDFTHYDGMTFVEALNDDFKWMRMLSVSEERAKEYEDRGHD